MINMYDMLTNHSFQAAAFLAVGSVSHIAVALLAPPVVLPVAALALVPLGVVEVAVVAPPAVHAVAALALRSLGHVPPIGWIVASAASLHVVALGIAAVACRARPVVLSVAAASALHSFLDALFAVLAVPLHCIQKIY